MSSSSRRDLASLDLASNCGPIQIRVLNHDLMPVAEGTRKLKVELPAGVYQLEFGLGEWRETRFLTLRPGETHHDHDLSMPFPTAFPVGSLDAWEIQQLELIHDLSHNPTSRPGEGGSFLLSVRLGRPEGGERRPPALDDLALLDAEGHVVCQLSAQARSEADRGWVGAHVQLDPGAYRLRWRGRLASRWSETEVIEQQQALWMQPGWITGLFLHASPQDGRPNMAGMSVHMRRSSMGFEEYEYSEREKNLAAEMVLESLRGGEPVGMAQSELLFLLLEAKFKDPMLGIVAAHALLGERWSRTRGQGKEGLSRRGPRWSVFDTVVRNLDDKLVPHHPDVLALRYLGKSVRESESHHKTRTRSEPLRWPPMVYAGCSGVLDRTWDEDAVVVRGSLLENLAPYLQRRGPWTAWEAFEAPGETAEKRRVAPDEASDAEAVLQRIVDGISELDLRKPLEEDKWNPIERQVAHYIGRQVPLRTMTETPLVNFDDLRGTGLSRDSVVVALDDLAKKLKL